MANTAGKDGKKSEEISLFDIQVNGFGGVDFQRCNLSRADLLRCVKGLASHQTLRFFVTLTTDQVELLARKFENLEQIRHLDDTIASAVCGYHLEGPWLSPEPGFRGAHDPRYLQNPDLKAFQTLQKAAGGNIRLVTVAPELPGSIEFIRAVVDMGVRVSLGHTNAFEREIDAAIEAGARFCTHVGNAVPLELPRHDNIVQRLLARDELTAFFIPDGLHLPPNVLKNFFRAKPEGKALFTTDCMAAAGSPPGRYSLGGLVVEMGADRITHAPGSKHFAGSSLCPDEGVRNVQTWLGLNPKEARRLFSTAIADAFQMTLPPLSQSHELARNQI
jgi:N-acetylglucosamine-6-phosphate deacetylase